MDALVLLLYHFWYSFEPAPLGSALAGCLYKGNPVEPKITL